MNRFDLFLGFFDEQLDELRVDRLRRRNGDQRIGCRVVAFGALQSDRFGWIELDRPGGIATRDADVRDARQGFIRQRLDAHLGVVQHVPWIVTPALQRLHVVLDAHDGVGNSFQADGVRRGLPGLDQLAHLGTDRIHHFHRPALAQHQEARGDATQQLRHVVEALRRKIAGPLHGNRHGLLDARHVDDALAQHRFTDQSEFEILIRRHIGGRPIRRHGQYQAHQLIVEAVFDREQDTGHLDQ